MIQSELHFKAGSWAISSGLEKDIGLFSFVLYPIEYIIKKGKGINVLYNYILLYKVINSWHSSVIVLRC